MNSPHSNRPELDARNAAMREQMNSLLDGLDRQTEQLKQAQSQAMSLTGEATSEDGLVTVRVNSVGIVKGLDMSPSAFRATTPAKLSETIVLTIQEAARNVRAQSEETLAPVQQNAPDLPDLFPGAPSLKDLIPQPPDVPADLDEFDKNEDEEDDEDELPYELRKGNR